MAKCRKDVTRFLDRYRLGVLFLERYERRKASGECTVAHERMKSIRLEEMEKVEEAINAVHNESYRKLLYYKYISLLDYYEIGKLVNRKAENVQRAMYRAIKLIEIPEGWEL